MNAFEKIASIYEQAGFYKEAGLAADLTKEQMAAARPVSEMPGGTRRNLAAWNSHPLNKGRQSAYVTHAGVTYKNASVYEQAGFKTAEAGTAPVPQFTAAEWTQMRGALDAQQAKNNERAAAGGIRGWIGRHAQKGLQKDIDSFAKYHGSKA